MRLCNQFGKIQHSHFSPKYASFSSFWNASLHDGGVIVGGGSSASYSGNASAALRNISKSASSELEISFFEPVSVGNGQYL